VIFFQISCLSTHDRYHAIEDDDASEALVIFC